MRSESRSVRPGSGAGGWQCGFFFSSRRRHTRLQGDWSSDVCSSDLYSPGLILLLIAAFVLSAAFHELGHGAGLRYGGGTVRAMGVGLYLVYPVFYTDITDRKSVV